MSGKIESLEILDDTTKRAIIATAVIAVVVLGATVIVKNQMSKMDVMINRLRDSL